MEQARDIGKQNYGKETCPNCGKRAGLPIAFGMPTDPGNEDFYYVAYCTFLAPGINMGCAKCNHTWHSPSVGQPSR